MPPAYVKKPWHNKEFDLGFRLLIVQAIFRLVYGWHEPQTIENLEWLDNMFNVALKAEEIMYSKADSEAEYRDVDTLWVRVMEAIRTIIKFSSTVSNRDIFPPCIEAAFHLSTPTNQHNRRAMNNSLLRLEAVPRPLPSYFNQPELPDGTEIDITLRLGLPQYHINYVPQAGDAGGASSSQEGGNVIG